MPIGNWSHLRTDWAPLAGRGGFDGELQSEISATTRPEPVGVKGPLQCQAEDTAGDRDWIGNRIASEMKTHLQASSSSSSAISVGRWPPAEPRPRSRRSS